MKDQRQLHQDPRRVRRSFSRGLQSYHHNATVQEQIAVDLVSEILVQDVPKNLSRVLEFGCGTGHLTSALLGCFDVCDLTLNDLVPESAVALEDLLRSKGQAAEFCFGSIEELPLSGTFDLIASASTVQWIEDLAPVLSRLTHHLAPSGWLALTGFGRQQFHQLTALGSGAAAPGYLDAAEWSGLLPPELELVSLRQKAIDLEFTSGLELLRHLRLTGVNGQANQRWGRRDLLRFEERYQQRFGRAGRLPLTYDAVWVLARKRS